MPSFNSSYHGQRAYNLETIQHAVPKLWVIGVCSNPVRYGTRYNLFDKWHERIKRAPGVNVFIVEVQQGEREFVVTQKDNPCHLQMRTTDELWIKENMVNRAINQITCGVGERVAGIAPAYVMWCDTDIYFEHETTWHYETLHQLQTYDLVQCWETAVDLGPTGQIISPTPHQSFMSCYRKYGKKGYKNGSGTPLSSYYGPTPPGGTNAPYYHPGYVWAAKLEKFSRVGLLPERCVIGAGDHHLAMCAVGMGEHSVPYDFRTSSPYYLEMILDYQRKCERVFEGRVGFVNGSIYHWFHGRKKNRNYWGRWDCIRPKKDDEGKVIEGAYDPYLDVFSDAQGLLQLDGEKPQMRDALHDYMRARQEDSIDLE
jgi:hypothetical protein